MSTRTKGPCERDLTDTRSVSCPKPGCGFPVYLVDDIDGDGFATCACGASVDLDGARELVAATTISPYLGKGERGARRKTALKKLAGDAGFRFDGEPSIGRWLCDLADEAHTKGPLAPLSTDLLPLAASMYPQELDDLEDAILIRRQRMLVGRLNMEGFETTTGDSEDWAWTNYATVHNPTSDRVVYADLAELRILLDTVREMKDPAAAFKRWLPKVKEVRKE